MSGVSIILSEFESVTKVSSFQVYKAANSRKRLPHGHSIKFIRNPRVTQLWQFNVDIQHLRLSLHEQHAQFKWKWISPALNVRKRPKSESTDKWRC